MKIAILNDTHFGIHNNSSIFFEYQKLFYDDVFFPYLEKNGINKIWHLGDFFDHRKQININTLFSTRKMFLEPLVEKGIFMTIIPGNHDTFYKNTIRVTSLKELLGYFTNNIEIIMDPKDKVFDGKSIAFIPWITSENYNESIRFINKTKSDVLCSHLELNGFEMMRGMKSHEGMSPDIFKKFKTVLTGHFHTKSITGNIHYCGSQMEFTWSDWNDPKYFHVFDTESGQITAVRNPHILFKKIFYNDGIYTDDYDFSALDNKFVKVVVEEKRDAFLFEQFIDKLQQTVKNLHELKIIESYAEFLGESLNNEDESEISNVELDTTQLMSNYIDFVNTTLDKSMLKTILLGLHAEALREMSEETI